jgi:thiamine transport system permease protein
MDRGLDQDRPALSESGWRRRSTLVMLAPPFAFIALFLLYPLQEILRVSLFRADVLDELAPLVEDSFYLERAWFTFWQASLSTALTIALALPCAYVLAHYRFPGRSLLLAVASVPFVLPAIVVAAAFTALLGPRGLLNSALQELFALNEPPIALLNTIWIILIAHVFYNFAVAARIIAGYWANIDPRLGEAAALLGAGRAETFLRVTLPLLRPPLLAAASLLFLFCFTSFGVILVLGGSRYGTLETEIYRETLFLFRLPIAAALGIVQLLFTFLVTLTNAHFSRQSAASAFQSQRVSPWTPRSRVAVAAVMSAMVVFAVVPLLALAERSFHGAEGYTLEFYRALGRNLRNQALFIPATSAMRNSLAFAALTLALAVPLGTFSAYASARLGRRGAWLDAFLLLPLSVSAVTLGLGFLITFDEPPLSLRGTWLLLVFAHTLVAYPFVARSVGAQLRGIDPRLREAARMLGAGPAEVFWRVDLPLIWRGIAAGAVFAFAVSMGEFGATLLIARPEFTTIPVAVFRFLGQPGELQYGQALALSTILMAVTAAGFLLLDRLRYRDLGSF